MKRLNAEDIIDLEIFIKRDEKLSEEIKAARDFKIFSGASDAEKRDEVALIRRWIACMREKCEGGSAGAAAVFVFRMIAIFLFFAGMLLLGMPLANAFFSGADFGGVINASCFFISCVFVPLVLFLSALFIAPALGRGVDLFASYLLKKFFGERGGLKALYGANKKWIFLKGAIVAQFLGLGAACGIFLVQLFRPMFNEYEYGWRTTMPSVITSKTMARGAKIVALPWILFTSEGRGYPSFEQIEKSKFLAGEGAKLTAESCEAWAIFFILASFFYGVVLRGAVLGLSCCKISRNYYGVDRIKNDGKISEILRRMRYASRDKSANLPDVSAGEGVDTALLLRSDLAEYAGAILPGVKACLNGTEIEEVRYGYGREIFSEAVGEKIAGKKNIALVFLADDYNEETFENIENLVNNYPEKFLSVHLLGRFSKAQGAFGAPTSTEKSWWARKINSISSRNVKLF